jgi:OPT oligopeptide transporter protein
MVVGWAVLSPLSKLSGWAPGPVGDMANGARGWILWTSLGIMCADSLVSLMPVIVDYVNDFILMRQKHHSAIDEDNIDTHETSHETETEDRLVPMTWVLTGVTTSVLIGSILVWIVFGDDGIKPWATILGFMLGGMLSIIGYVCSLCPSPVYPFLYFRVRALGETDLNPVSGLGKISQLFFAWIQPGNVVANIIAGGVAEAGAQQ